MDTWAARNASQDARRTGLLGLGGAEIGRGNPHTYTLADSLSREHRVALGAIPGVGNFPVCESPVNA